MSLSSIKIFALTALIITGQLLSPGIALADAGTGATVSISPAESIVGTTVFTVDVIVDSGAIGSRGAECAFTFTPGLLECTGIDNGDYYKDWGPLRIGPAGTAAIHNDTGTIDDIGIFATTGSPGEGAYNAGKLFTLHFRALTNGTANITISGAAVGDLFGDAIVPIVTVNGTVQIELLPDLVVSGITPSWVEVGSTYGVDYTIKNIGGAAAAPFTTILDIDGQPLNASQGTLAAGENVTYSFSGPRQVSGLQDTVKVTTDTDNTVAEGNESNNSAQVNWAVGTIPAAPTGLAAEVQGDRYIKLTWQDNSDNEDGFIIERALNSVFNSGLTSTVVAANVVLYVDTATVTETTYYYRVYAYNEMGRSGPSNTVQILAAKMPNAPTDLILVSSNATDVRLKWTDASNNEDGFYLERAENTKFDKRLRKFEVAKNNSSSAYFIDTTFKTNTIYYYRVRAYKGTYYTAYSNSIQVYVIALAEAPSALNYVVLDSEGLKWVALNWVDNSENELGFRIERARNEAFTLELRHFNVPDNILSFVDKTVLPYVEYYYRVFAYNPSGDSEPSAVVRVKTMENPGAPSGLRVSSMSQGEISLTWQDNTPNEFGFRVERALSDNFSEGLVRFNIDAGTTSFTDKKVKFGLAYYYRVTAFNIGGDSDYSNVVSVKIPAQPQAPSRLGAELDKAGNVALSWQDNADNEAGFRIERASDRGFLANLRSFYVGADVTTYVDTGKPDTSYAYYRVYAYNTQVTYNVVAESRRSNTAYVQLDKAIQPAPDWDTSLVKLNELSMVDLSEIIDGNGFLTKDVSCQDLNGVKKIYIGEGTLVIDKYGKPVRRIEIQPVNMLALGPSETSLVSLPMVMRPFGKSAPPLTITMERHASIASYVYDLEPSGATLDTPLTLTLEYDPSLCPPGSKADDMTIAYYDSSHSQWVEIESQVDARGDTVTANVTHFSMYGVLVKGTPIIQVWVIGLTIILGMGLCLGVVYFVRIRRNRD